MSKITIFVLGICLFVNVGILPADQSSKIHPWVLTYTDGGQKAEFFVVLKDRPDLSQAFQMSQKIDRGTFVYKSLYDTAQQTQAPLKQWLTSRGIQYRSFYIINALLIKAGRDIAEELAKRDDVDRIEGNPVIRNMIPEPISETKSSPHSPEAIEWNITKTKAPDMWNLGYTGQGIVVGGADTGYRWTHNALKGKYRGWDGTNADHDYNWHDSVHSGGGSCGSNSAAPCDDNGHGTHTMGTVVGDDGGSNQVGMAPGAKWIGCRNMDQGNGTPATYLECFEFFLAPYPVGGNPGQGDPSMAPDVTSNSWSCPPSEGCSAASLQAAVDAQKAAGIMTVAAAQNSGPSCGTVNDPIGIYASAYTVGSTTNTANNLLSSFSSRGPADSTNLVKPNIVAPGSNVRSASRTS
ncbi:MAG TPA: S8 family serine peptidase, partial [Acidobacteriota bacterium]|nr:S8 family serine peptidase [Acidobacteriota bacterium]